MVKDLFTQVVDILKIHDSTLNENEPIELETSLKNMTVGKITKSIKGKYVEYWK